MARFHHHSHAPRSNEFHYGVRNVLGQSLLNLQASAEHLGDPWELRKAHDGVVGLIANVHPPRERDHMVFAHAKDLDVLDHDHLVVVLGEDGLVDNIPEVLLIALSKEHDRLGIPLWGMNKARPIRIFTDAFEYGPHSLAYRGKSLGAFFGGLVPSFPSTDP
jgi:hypothetical protein